MERLLYLLACLFLIQSASGAIFEGSLDERLTHYEKVHTSAVKRQVYRRSAHSSGGSHEQIVNVDVLGEHFRLHLRSVTGLFSPGFKVVAVHGDDTEEEVPVDTREFYTGFVEGERGSSVSAHWEGQNLAAVIHARHDTYVIEPSWRHTEDSDKYSMIAYRYSDLRKHAPEDKQHHFCGLVDDDGTDHAPYTMHAANEIHGKHPDDKSRVKRQSTTRTRCTVALVADHTAYRAIGERDISTTVKYLGAVFTEVNNIFLSSDFGRGASYGLEIGRIVVHTEYSSQSGHYNSERDWGTTELLTAFSKEPWDEYCLAHLFTSQAFSGGVLGLAWVAGAARGTLGGICQGKSGSNYYNTGWSSSSNSAGRRLTTMEASLVTAHEFGHGWGSPHDPDIERCAPSGGDGRYLMYTYSVNGDQDNNNEFSECSRNTIEQVLKTKSSCFVEPSTSAVCGNLMVEGEEQCDPGVEGATLDNDPCCTSDCQLREGASCSDLNEACCGNCTAAPSSQLCKDEQGTCQEDVFCDTSGINSDCPDTSEDKANGTECGITGSCSSGVCLSVCETQGMTDCMCEARSDVCSLCCQTSDDSSTCAPYEPNDRSLELSDGTPCNYGGGNLGYCDSGSCKTEIRDVTKRLWDIVGDVESFSGFVRFMRDNIVLSVVILSLLLYAPFVIFILVLDHKRNKKDEDERDWMRKDNEELLPPEAREHVRSAGRVRSRMCGQDGVDNGGYVDCDALAAADSRHVHLH